MENLGKKAGYLKGLMDGMDFDSKSSQGKLIAGIVDLLGDMSERIENINELLNDLNDYVESIDDDLSELEGAQDDDAPLSFFGDDEDDEDDDFEDFEDDDFGGEDQLHLLRSADGLEADDENEPLAGALCPNCTRMFFVSMTDPDDASYACPHCGETVQPIPLTPENAPIAKPTE